MGLNDEADELDSSIPSRNGSGHLDSIIGSSQYFFLRESGDPNFFVIRANGYEHAQKLFDSISKDEVYSHSGMFFRDHIGRLRIMYNPKDQKGPQDLPAVIEEMIKPYLEFIVDRTGFFRPGSGLTSP